MESIGTLARESRERITSAPTEAQAPAPESPYKDATEPVGIPGTSKVAVVVRDSRSGALYACTRNVSGNGRAARVHMDALATLGFVHVSDTETLAEVGFVSPAALADALSVLSDAQRKKVEAKLPAPAQD